MQVAEVEIRDCFPHAVPSLLNSWRFVGRAQNQARLPSGGRCSLVAAVAASGIVLMRADRIGPSGASKISSSASVQNG